MDETSGRSAIIELVIVVVICAPLFWFAQSRAIKFWGSVLVQTVVLTSLSISIPLVLDLFPGNLLATQYRLVAVLFVAGLFLPSLIWLFLNRHHLRPPVVPDQPEGPHLAKPKSEKYSERRKRAGY